MLLNANAATDYVIDRDLAANDARAAYNEAVDAKQELIIKTISEGGEIGHFNMRDVIDAILVRKDTETALISGYHTDNFEPFKALVNKEINRIAEMLAPGMVDAELERHPGAA